MFVIWVSEGRGALGVCSGYFGNWGGKEAKG